MANTLTFMPKGGVIKVNLDNRIVGEIRPVDGGYRYFPKGQKNGGETFKTLSACQRSLWEE